MTAREAAAMPAGPNDAIRAVLSPADRDRYTNRLDDCAAQAQRRLGLPPDVLVVPERLDDGYLDVPQRAEADARVSAARRAYAACMAAEGFPTMSGETLRAEVARRATLLRETVGGVDAAELRRLQRYEVAAAVADRACGRQLYPVVERVHDEYLRRYLDGG